MLEMNTTVRPALSWRPQLVEIWSRAVEPCALCALLPLLLQCVLGRLVHDPMPSLLAVPAAVVLVVASTSSDAEDKPTVSSLDGSLPAVRGRFAIQRAAKHHWRCLADSHRAVLARARRSRCVSLRSWALAHRGAERTAFARRQYPLDRL